MWRSAPPLPRRRSCDVFCPVVRRCLSVFASKSPTHAHHSAMSSLAAARADNFYHPPDWDPRKESRAAHDVRKTGGPAWKAHPLRERAKKLDEGILVIRFEMPFDVRCSGCGCRIGKGVRFDAEKKAVGKYLSTKIWSFRMLCKAEQEGNAKCDQKRNPHFIEVRTDPKNAEYVVTEGAQILFTSSKTAVCLAQPAPKHAHARCPDRALAAPRGIRITRSRTESLFPCPVPPGRPTTASRRFSTQRS
jgi:hypothetical protein